MRDTLTPLLSSLLLSISSLSFLSLSTYFIFAPFFGCQVFFPFILFFSFFFFSFSFPFVFFSFISFSSFSFSYLFLFFLFPFPFPFLSFPFFSSSLYCTEFYSTLISPVALFLLMSPFSYYQ